jgi:hypothetical protein
VAVTQALALRKGPQGQSGEAGATACMEQQPLSHASSSHCCMPLRTPYPHATTTVHLRSAETALHREGIASHPDQTLVPPLSKVRSYESLVGPGCL